jgi:2-C-methyl-D-erythritol 4-phosphate cytidylyltransferase
MPGVSIVIVAAGSGSRMGRGDKLFLDVGGLPLIGHTWQRFDRLPETTEIIIVTRDDARPLFEDLAKRHRCQVGVGGDTGRREAVHTALGDSRRLGRRPRDRRGRLGQARE